MFRNYRLQPTYVILSIVTNLTFVFVQNGTETSYTNTKLDLQMHSGNHFACVYFITCSVSYKALEIKSLQIALL